ncbi:uncharacterized protein LOC133792286 [Humulus lupulus]|uniref:uncharacterized protein LOC133792286 n=1 Tax=Humulus lupulus TaxID=3486 RepID=UPI002B408812|nr:uncharacterized protein LOC133792286 [Humulus lupulus]
MVLGANSPFAVFEGFVERIWGHLGIERVVRMHMGLTIVKFNDEATRDFVLENGVVQFDRKPVIVRPWTQELDSIRLVRSVPLWIRLPNLGLQYWGKNCLSALVSTIGKPIMVDKFTKDRSMIKFAKVLVEMDITDDPPFLIHFVNERGQLQEQFVEYEWLPIKCSTCKGYGHNAAKCKKSETKAWVSKSKPDQNLLLVLRLLRQHLVRHLSLKRSWNVRGLNKRDKQHAILRLLKVNKVGICALLKNKLKGDKVQDMMSKVMVGWDCFNNPATEGRILVLWQRSFVSVQVLLVHQQFVHCLVRFSGLQQDLVVTFVYGFSLLAERLEMWRGLSSLSILNLPWLVVGDFNSVFEFDDRVGGREIGANELVDSTAWLANSHLAKLKCVGSNFTWSNKQEGGDRVYSKIDHAFINEGWIDCQLNSIAELHWELIRLKHILRKFNRTEIGDIEQQFHQAKGEYQVALTKVQDSPFDIFAQETEKKAAINYKIHYARYRSFLIQRSKVTWLQKGDENTAYFHACIKKRREENRIVSFLNDNGDIIDDYNSVVHHFLAHFKSFMGSSSLATGCVKTDFMEVGPCLEIDKQLDLIRDFTKADVKKAIFSIPGTKTPGLDGMPTEINKTVITLVPQNDAPSRAVHFRPIACYNTLYKCISKMLCSRLSEVLPFIISPNQGAFIRGRSLAHNILIFQDLIKNYNRKNTSPRCVLKIDLSKAYDTVDWVFLERLLTCFRFPTRFINWVMVCLKGSSYILIMNGRLQGDFQGVKGLHQGDPISPLLFVLVMEYLSRLLQFGAMQPTFWFHPMCKSLKIINLCFADDLVIFCKANYNSVQIIKQLFDEFCTSSGMKANLNKSQVFFGGISAQDKSQLQEVLHLEEGSFPLKYLGIPMRPTKWKEAGCGEILKKN